MDAAGKIHTLYEGCWSRQYLSKDTIAGGFMAARRRLKAMGIALENPSTPALDPEADNSEDEDEKFQYAAPAEVRPAPPHEGPGGWPLVASFGWCLRSDGVLTEDAVEEALGRLGARGPETLILFLHAREAELAADPYLATKSRALRLQFAALGQEWFAALQESPSLADYLQGEAQAVDLEAALM